MNSTIFISISLILAFLICGCSSPLEIEGKKITVDGHITRATDNSPISGCSVTIYERCYEIPENPRNVTQVKSTSNSNGYYSITFELDKFCDLSKLTIYVAPIHRRDLPARSQTQNFAL